MKIPDAKAGKLEKDKSNKEVIKEAQKNNNNKVPFASVMDICHLKNSELEPQFLK